MIECILIGALLRCVELVIQSQHYPSTVVLSLGLDILGRGKIGMLLVFGVTLNASLWWLFGVWTLPIWAIGVLGVLLNNHRQVRDYPHLYRDYL